MQRREVLKMTSENIIRDVGRIEAGDGEYIAAIFCDRCDEISDVYILKLLEWAKSVWDWEAVVTIAENRAESLEGPSDDRICYNLSSDDVDGLLGGKYGGSPGKLPGWGDRDGWGNINAYVWMPAGRFSDEVIAELEEVA